MKVVLTKVETIGKTGGWLKLSFVNPKTGEAGNALTAMDKTILEMPVANLAEDYEADVDIDFNQQGRITSVTPV